MEPIVLLKASEMENRILSPHADLSPHNFIEVYRECPGLHGLDFGLTCIVNGGTFYIYFFNLIHLFLQMLCPSPSLLLSLWQCFGSDCTSVWHECNSLIKVKCNAVECYIPFWHEVSIYFWKKKKSTPSWLHFSYFSPASFFTDKIKWRKKQWNAGFAFQCDMLALCLTNE